MDIAGNSLVIGGGGGIGRACAILFAKAGARVVVIADLNLQAASETLAECQAMIKGKAFKGKALKSMLLGNLLFARSLVTSLKFWVALTIVSTVLIGVQEAADITSLSMSEFQRFLDVNATALDNTVYGIRVNCVCPSWTNTPLVQKAIEGVKGLGDFINRAVPMGWIAVPDEVADAVIFLCRPRSSYVTGCGLIIDGGTTLTALR
ncbi:hypothetical protein ANO14919_127110 [Xylariales sp. No.14919]|nr:hypothetical protein ANO14919_127110 [Xylariales sp. No.14919]